MKIIFCQFIFVEENFFFYFHKLQINVDFLKYFYRIMAKIHRREHKLEIVFENSCEKSKANEEEILNSMPFWCAEPIKTNFVK